MKKHLLVCLLISLLLGQVHAYSQPQSLAKRKVLVLTERGGLHEGFVAAALPWLDSFAQKHNLEIKVINHPGEVDNELLSDYSLFIQLNYPPYNWTHKTRTAFEKYIDEGQGSWIGFHHATLLGEFDGFPMWNWFSEFMGGIRFKNYIAKKATATVKTEAATHPVMKDLPNQFVIPDDEWYTFDRNPRVNVSVLAHVDENSYQPTSDIKMGDHPVIWSNEKKKAKNVYFLMGHSAGLLNVEAFTKMVGNAILWGLEK
ncbi:ThuA domain-containing protein [Spirosoma sp.]|uniref:ThuA domain-containing protein n=1 Tax=Spirosoma sp. TaxID=1899569 RepID=UPI00260C57D5|nr:ThuA domain-containing protein [Spirosoma sp.]MCX6216309.1 ThuA domain-containing protein [Spirosoma sp.]